MNSGLYTAFLGMRARQRTLEVQANNIANASTDGFKADRLRYTSIEADQKANENSQLSVTGVLTTSTTDFTSGALFAKPAENSIYRSAAMPFFRFKPNAVSGSHAPEVLHRMPAVSSLQKTAIS